MKWNSIPGIFFNLFSKKASPHFDISSGFPPEMEKQIIESSLTTASQVLISASVMTCSTEIIKGDVIFPDGSAWRLTFAKIKPEEAGEVNHE